MDTGNVIPRYRLAHESKILPQLKLRWLRAGSKIRRSHERRFHRFDVDGIDLFLGVWVQCADVERSLFSQARYSLLGLESIIAIPCR